MKIPEHVSQSFKQRNPHLYPVGKMEAQVAEPASPQALDRVPSKRKAGKVRVELCVTLIAGVKRTLDDDNLIGACKPLRDAIARDLRIDDGDRRVRWEYSQFQTKSEEGGLLSGNGPV